MMQMPQRRRLFLPRLNHLVIYEEKETTHPSQSRRVLRIWTASSPTQFAVALGQPGLEWVSYEMEHRLNYLRQPRPC